MWLFSNTEKNNVKVNEKNKRRSHNGFDLFNFSVNLSPWPLPDLCHIYVTQVLKKRIKVCMPNCP